MFSHRSIDATDPHMLPRGDLSLTWISIMSGMARGCEDDVEEWSERVTRRKRTKRRNNARGDEAGKY